MMQGNQRTKKMVSEDTICIRVSLQYDRRYVHSQQASRPQQKLVPDMLMTHQSHNPPSCPDSNDASIPRAAWQIVVVIAHQPGIRSPPPWSFRFLQVESFLCFQPYVRIQFNRRTRSTSTWTEQRMRGAIMLCFMCF